MIWAPLKKSPNWASQMIKFLGFSTDMPYSNPKTASSDKGLFAISNWPHSTGKYGRLSTLSLSIFQVVTPSFWSFISLNGMNISFEAWSTNMAWRWAKVARPTSCPLNLTLNPWYKSDPTAKHSAVPQSIMDPDSSFFILASTWIFFKCGCKFWEWQIVS